MKLIHENAKYRATGLRKQILQQEKKKKKTYTAKDFHKAFMYSTRKSFPWASPFFPNNRPCSVITFLAYLLSSGTHSQPLAIISSL